MNPLTLKALLSNSKRSLHVVYVVAFSVAIIFSSFTIADSFIDRVNILTQGYTLTDTYYLVEKGESIYASEVAATVLESIEIEYSTPLIQCSVNTGTQKFTLWGIEQESFNNLYNPRITGVLPVNTEEVCVGVNLAYDYTVNIGDLITIRSSEFEATYLVTGFIRTNTFYDDGIVACLETGWQHRPELEEKYSLIALKTSIKDPVLSLADESLMVIPSISMRDYIVGVISDINRNLSIISAIISILALITVSHTMYKIITDSMSDYMILRSLGLTKNGLIVSILLNSIILSSLGGLFGIILGNLLTNGASILFFISTGSIYLPVNYSQNTYLGCLILAVLLGAIGGLLATLIKGPNRETYGALKSI